MKDITSTDIKRLMLSSYRRYRNGEISEHKAVKENMLLGNILRTIEVSEQSERVSSLEGTLKRLSQISDDE